MTHLPARLVGRVLLVLCALAPAPGVARAEPPVAPRPKQPDLPEPLVARICDAQGKVVGELTRDGLAFALAHKYLSELANERSAAFTILRESCEERLVQQEAQKLGLIVSPAEIEAEERKLDSQLRVAAGGQQTLADLRKSKGMSAEDFRRWLGIELLKAKIAEHPAWLGKLPPKPQERMNQISVVIIELHKRAAFRWGVPNGLGKPVERLDPGVLVLVNDAPVTQVAFGQALLSRLPEDDIKDVLQRECATKALESEGVQLSDASMTAELALREGLWTVQRSMMGDDRWRTLGFDQYLEGVLKLKRSELQQNRYYRSFYGLVAAQRSRVTEAELQAEFERKKDTHYGPAVVVHGLQVGFVRKAGVFGGGEGREKRDALQILLAAKQAIAAGRPFSDAVREVVAQHKDPRNPGLPDPSVREGLRRLFNISADELLYRAAILMRDGEISQVIETLSEVYLLRRERLEPGRTFADVRDVIREALAGARARQHLEDVTQDARRVQIRWPLRGGS